MVGAHVRYAPMYPNFPEQVMNASEAELYLNAIRHYVASWFNKVVLPEYEKHDRPVLGNEGTLRVISLGSKNDFNNIFTSLLQAKTAISEDDKESLKWFVKTYSDGITKYIPDTIPMKENIGLLGAYLLQFTTVGESFAKENFRTATDVLRLALALSEGDVSLAEWTKFKTFSKKLRRAILQLLEPIANKTEDMLRYKETWKRLGEKLHPGEYKKRFPTTCDAFDIIRNDLAYETYNSKVELYLKYNNTDALLELLKARPGEFARKLDKLIRDANNKQAVVDGFEQVVDKVSSPVLLQVFAHFSHRPNMSDIRVFFPKGEVAKLKAIPNNLVEIDSDICKQVAQICRVALVARYSKLPTLGNVYIEDD